MSTTLKIAQLKLLRKIGFKYLKARSNFKVQYLISLGDSFSQNPFFKPECNTEEIIVCVAWSMQKDEPVIFDIGAHCGYFCTHFAALLKNKSPRIYSFEPVAPTYFDLLQTIYRLDINDAVYPIHAALSNEDSIVTLSYSKWDSMLAHIIPNNKAGKNNLFALSTTADKVANIFDVFPDLIKLDVEGYESNVLRGASSILQSDNKPAICIEWNPGTLLQCGSSKEELASVLTGYECYYINDYEGKGNKFMEKVNDISAISWTCNLFAVPLGYDKIDSWKKNVQELQKQYNISI